MKAKKKQNFNKVLFISVAGVLVATSFFIGVFFGARGFNQIGPFKILPDVFVNKDKDKPQEVDFSLFWEAYNKLNEEYLGELDPNKLLYGAIKGLTEASGDPYTTYMDPDQAKEYLSEIEGVFSGIGIEIGVRNKSLVVISPLTDTPAEKAGLRARDVILKIDDEDTFNMSLDQAVSKIRGQEGTKVKLLIQRNTQTEEVTITRATINVKSVKLEFKNYKNKNYAYVKINQFTQKTPDEFSEAVDQIILKNPQGLILDLRGNPGGYLESAVEVSSEFLDGGNVVIEQLTNRKKEIKTTKEGKLTNIKTIVLIDEGSASASEIVAGALKDRDRAKLVGKKTFGKGSVQIPFNLSKGIIKITMAKWLTPAGNFIDEVGIKPDFEVDLTEDDLNNFRDPQLNKALEIIGG